MITDIIGRLDDQVADLKLIEGAISYAAVQVQPPDAKMPAAYVVELTEAFAKARGMSGALAQDGVATFGVILWMNAQRVDKAKAATALKTLRDAVRAALFGWSPPGSEGAAFTNAGGRLLAAQDNLLVWQSSFAIDFQERQ